MNQKFCALFTTLQFTALGLVACDVEPADTSSAADTSSSADSTGLQAEPEAGYDAASNELVDPPNPSLVVSQQLPGALDLSGDIDDWILPSVTATTPGMLVAVVRGNHIAAIGAGGYSYYPFWIPDGDEIFNIGSNSKNMTALALSYLIEENSSLSWSTTLEDAMPFVTNWGGSSSRNASLIALVGHTAGFRDSGCNVAWPSGWKNMNSQTALRTKASYFAQNCGGASFGYDYSNINFHMAQAIIEYWTNQPLKNYMKAKFVDPWDMDGSFLWTRPPELARSSSGFSGTPAQVAVWEQFFADPTHPLLSTGEFMRSSNADYSAYTLADPNLDPYGLYTGAGNIAINLQDWARYASKMMRSRDPAVRTIRETASVPLMTYEYGWNMSRDDTNGFEWSRMAHDGALPLGDSNARSMIVLYPQHDTAYLIYANGGPGPTAAMNAVYSAVRNSTMPPGGDDGCARSADLKSIQRFYDQEMFGCAGSVAFADRADLCAANFHVCSAAEFHSKNLAAHETPLYHYWTDDALRRSTTGGTNSCAVYDTGAGTACTSSAAPMRVCTDTQTDLLGNTCNWLKCGYGDTDNEWFGGCSIGANTAGTLCCAD